MHSEAKHQGKDSQQSDRDSSPKGHVKAEEVKEVDLDKDGRRVYRTTSHVRLDRGRDEHRDTAADTAAALKKLDIGNRGGRGGGGRNDLANTSISEAFKTIAMAAMAHLDSPGCVLSGLVGLLWPQDQPFSQVFHQLQTEFHKLLDYGLDAATANDFADHLGMAGLSSQLYLMLLQGSNHTQISRQWTTTKEIFEDSAHIFLNTKYNPQWRIGPFVGIYAVLHMSLLRDGRLHGLSWGWTPEEHQDHDAAAKAQLATYVDHLSALVADRERGLSGAAPKTSDNTRSNIYTFWQPFNVHATIGFDDYIVLLQHLYPATAAATTRIAQFKDVSSPAFGNSTTWDADTTARQFPGGNVGATWHSTTTNLEEFQVRTFNNAVPRAVTVNFTPPWNSGPFGHNIGTALRIDSYSTPVTAFRGLETDATARVRIPPAGPHKTFNVRSASVRVAATVPTLFQVTLDDGEVLTVWDSGIAGAEPAQLVEYPGRKLTTLSGWTLLPSQDYHIGCIILGFTKDVTEIPDEILRRLYITEVANLPKELEERIKGDKDELKEARDAYWKHLSKK